MIVRELTLDTVVGMLPGQHIVLLSGNPCGALEGRRQGLEVRDTLLVVSSRGSSFAFLFRKSLEGTVAENVVRYGVGGLWIDGCRIQTADHLANHSRSVGAAVSKGKYGSSKEQYTHQTEGQKLGRWPTNLVLIHEEECRLVGIRKFKPLGRTAKTNGTKGGLFMPSLEGQPNYTGEDGLQEMPDWVCQAGCVVKALDQQSGTLHSHGGGQSHTLGFGDMRKENGWAIPKGDSGGASRFFPQFSSLEEFEGWVRRLLGSLP